MTSADPIAFGQLIKGLREKMGLTQAELAERIGVSSSYISQVEVGRRIPADRLCIKLGEALTYDVHDLVDRARRARSPETETTLLHYREHHHQRRQGRQGVDDPRLKDLGERLRHLQAVLPKDRYERLLNTILGVLEPYTAATLARSSKRRT